MNQLAARVFTTLVLLVLSYEWLISGLNKVLSQNFVSQLGRTMLDSIPTIQYPFYANLLQRYAIPHSNLLGILVEVAEVSLGVSFLLLAFWAGTNRFNRKKLGFGMISGTVGVFMTLNFFFYQSGSFLINTHDLFDEGISIDLIMCLIQVAIVIFCSLGSTTNYSEKNIVG